MKNYDITATISQLFIHPIKSCAGIEVSEAVLTPTGLLYDRHWMLIDDDNRFMTQRDFPQMALIQPSLDNGFLKVSAPKMPDFQIPLNASGQEMQVVIWDDAAHAFDMGALAQDWFSQVLGISVRLVRFNPEKPRLCSQKWTAGTGANTQFSDGYPILVTSCASVEELNQRLVDRQFTAVDQRRFRPNVVLSGLSAHDEDLLGELHFESPEPLVLKNVKPCDRCPIPSVDPDTGVSQPEAVGDTLLMYRRNAQRNDEVTFGVNAIVLAGEGQKLYVGQKIFADYVF